MTTLAQLRKTALSLAGVTEAPERGRFNVDGTPFASAADGVAHLRLAGTDADVAVANHQACQRVADGISVPLAEINGMHLNALVRAAWQHCAPAQTTATLEAAEKAARSGAHDFPAAIGRPATRALLEAGVTTIAQAQAHTDAELLELHGVGPKAVKILRQQ